MAIPWDARYGWKITYPNGSDVTMFVPFMTVWKFAVPNGEEYGETPWETLFNTTARDRFRIGETKICIAWRNVGEDNEEKVWIERLSVN